ncbi:MAG: hypothetical protein K0Q70_1675 [Rhodospirillales bacterium]|jgi:hypothetical protein|nr:hypothetical protein [Rhodospirillales bacterium]
MAIRNKTTQNNPRDYDDEGSKSEVSAFKKGLLDISLETIRERLAGKTITRQWKRDLVEAELARREEDESADVVKGPAKKKGGRTGQWAAAAIIGLCSLIILYTMFEIWQK